MANEKTIANAAEPQADIMQFVAPLAGWLIPGLGHLIQKRWVRGLLIFVSVTLMFFCGLGMKGKVYGFNLGDLLDMLGFVGDFGNGLALFHRPHDGLGARAPSSAPPLTTAPSSWSAPDCSTSSPPIDAHHIAIGKKQ